MTILLICCNPECNAEFSDPKDLETFDSIDWYFTNKNLRHTKCPKCGYRHFFILVQK